MASISSLSRRHALAAGASALAAAPLWARADDDATIQGGKDSANRLTMETMVNGKGPYQFSIDTGADRSVIAAEVAQELGLAMGTPVTVEGIARSMPAQTANVRSLEFGHLEATDLSMPILPRAWLGTDGYLGLDVLADRRVVFDFQKRRMTVKRAAMNEEMLSPSDVIVRANGSKGRLRAVNCTVQGVQATAFIDSGAQASICNGPLFEKLQQVGSRFNGSVAIPVFGATGGEVQGRLTSVSDIQLGTMRFTRCELIVADLNVFKVWNLADRPALFIGMNFLQELSAFTIDYRRKEMQFRIAALTRLADLARG